MRLNEESFGATVDVLRACLQKRIFLLEARRLAVLAFESLLKAAFAAHELPITKRPTMKSRARVFAIR